ncbi:MAG: tetratricopeptide repeat protein [Nitrospinota bacterium]
MKLILFCGNTRVLIPALFVILSFFSCSKDKGESYQKHFEKGEAYLKQEKFDEAVIEFKNAVKIDPDNGLGHYKLGMAYVRKGNVPGLQQGFKELTKAVERNPELLDAQMKLA